MNPSHSYHNDSYFVTELLGTDLHRLLTSRPLEKQFIQYFLYQIMVRDDALFLFLPLSSGGAFKNADKIPPSSGV
jgi:hypothetical protein